MSDDQPSVAMSLVEICTEGGCEANSGVLLDGLTPGATYAVQARAVGGTTGYSDWSDPVSHMAT
ncbi:MAG: fibronectin type III domain-containing protein [Verrucomicrobia bacterium]|nr:fibronectin type III domain-containing protein [Verrucomicrobiota bacterium]